jgi:hypothetical protein
MAAAVWITRLELSSEALRRLASGLRDGAMVRRILALAMMLDGASREPRRHFRSRSMASQSAASQLPIGGMSLWT